MNGKAKTVFVCTQCGYETGKWMGRCASCGAWSTLQEETRAPEKPDKPVKRAPGCGNAEVCLRDISADAHVYRKTGISELDRVLGGGIVEGSMLLVGGEPGIGKSTLLLQACAHLCAQGAKVLYITGEESVKQIKLRANRLSCGQSDLLVLAENDMDAIREKLDALTPDVVVVDSIQTMYLPTIAGAPGSVSQVRQSASTFMQYAKMSGCAVFLVGHVTKEGAIAGPRVLEHMVDVVLYFEGDRLREYRVLRAVKNRYGSVNELGLFEMTGEGMRQVDNPSEMLLSKRARDASGSVVFCGLEGTRPMLVDVQALVAQSFSAVPRRTADGMDSGRVLLLLAVLEKRAGLRLYNKDVYVNIAGGLTLSEPAADLALCLSVVSSLRDIVLPPDWAVMGEVGLAGEVRAIPQMERRVSECARMGLTHILCPAQGVTKINHPQNVTLHGVRTLAQAVATAALMGTKADAESE